MGNVYIDPNLRKTSERIDPNGNIINPRTKEIITPIIEEYVEPTEAPKEVKHSMSDKINAMVETKIKEKIDAIVAQRVEEALKNL